MKILLIKTLLLLALLLNAQAALAKWIQGDAQMVIGSAPLDEIRVETIKNAVANAAFKGGSYISAEEVMLDGLLVSTKAEIRTEGQVQRVEILSETINDGVLNVVVRVKIMPLIECKNQHYARTLMVSQFGLLKPQQASHGKLFKFGSQISKRFSRQLKTFDSTATTQLLNQHFAQPQQIPYLSPDQLAENAAFLAQSEEAQYLIFGFIRDISLFETVKENLILSDDVDLKRNFTMEVFLLDVIQQKVIFSDSYHGEAKWEYDDHYKVDMNNSLFWRSDFGRMSLNLVNSAVNDIADHIACLPLYVPIIETGENYVMVGVGEQQGLKLDDKFWLAKRRTINLGNFADKSVLVNQQSYVYQVTQVDQSTAMLKLPDTNIYNPAVVLDYLTPSE